MFDRERKAENSKRIQPQDYKFSMSDFKFYYPGEHHDGMFFQIIISDFKIFFLLHNEIYILIPTYFFLGNDIDFKVSLKLPRTGHKNICQHPSSTSFDDSTEISKWDYNTHAVTHIVAKKNGTILFSFYFFC
jgi:hypothetical protein